jgi:Leucine-rich repeat (LRR) protein
LKLLSHLSLGNNRLTNITGAITILMGSKNLSILILAKKFLHEAMPTDDSLDGSDGFKSLRVLALGGCQLTVQLPTWISKLKKLEALDLTLNRITGPIPGWLSTLPRLFSLDLSNNLISGEFPKELCGLPALVSEQNRALVNQSYLKVPISIYRNGTNYQYNYISYMPQAIYLRNNSLHGNIPIEIGHLHLLHVLDLSYNNFSGNIPDQLSELTNLEKLDLSANQLSGKILASLTTLHFLSWFSVANNNIQGPIPSSTQFQTFGTSAYEGNPGLCGAPLPNECAQIISNNGDKGIQDEEEEWLGVPWFHVSVVLGFITGFWGVCGPLLFNYHWRVACFQFLDNVKYRLNMLLAAYMAVPPKRRLEPQSS